MVQAKQVKFVKLVMKLLEHIFSKGYEVTFGEAYRTPEQAWIYSLPAESKLVAFKDGKELKTYSFPVGGRGITKSKHIERLAIDLNLFKNGVFLSKTEAHKPFGEFWESLDPNCRWGGRWDDGNHYELR